MNIDKINIWEKINFEENKKSQKSKIITTGTFAFLIIIIGTITYYNSQDFGLKKANANIKNIQRETAKSKKTATTITHPQNSNVNNLVELVVPHGSATINYDQEFDVMTWLAFNSRTGYLSGYSAEWILEKFHAISYRKMGQDAQVILAPTFKSGPVPDWGFERKFDGVEPKFIKFDEMTFAFMPKMEGFSFIAKNWHSALKPNQTIQYFLTYFSNFYNNDEWDKEKIFDWAIFQYAAAYGVNLDRDKLEIENDGGRSFLLIYNGDLPEVKIQVYIDETDPENDNWYDFDKAMTKPKIVEKTIQLTDELGQLLFYASIAPNQALFLPRSSLRCLSETEKLQMQRKFRTKEKSFNIALPYESIKREWKKVKLAKNKEKDLEDASIGKIANFYPYVITNDLQISKISRLITKDKNSRDQKIKALWDFTMSLPKFNDGEGTDGKKSETPMPFWTTLANTGGDCDKHAITFLSLLANSRIKNNLGALAVLRHNQGCHLISMVIGGDKWRKWDDPYYNHITWKEKDYYFLEATIDNNLFLGEYTPGEHGFDLLMFRPLGYSKWLKPFDISE